MSEREKEEIENFARTLLFQGPNSPSVISWILEEVGEKGDPQKPPLDEQGQPQFKRLSQLDEVIELQRTNHLAHLSAALDETRVYLESEGIPIRRMSKNKWRKLKRYAQNHKIKPQIAQILESYASGRPL